MNWLVNLLKKMKGFFTGRSKTVNHESELKPVSSSGLVQNPLNYETKKTASSSTGSSPEKKAVDKSKEKKTETITTRKETATSTPASNTTQKIEPLRIHVTGKPFKTSITGGLNETLLNTRKQVNYDPNNRFKQNVAQTFPLVIMPTRNTDIKPPLNGKSSNKGMTEESFCRDFLMKYFKNQVFDSLSLFIGSTPFEPDLAFIDLTSGKNIFIDIEIDEPYDGVTRNPTHYRTTQGGTADDNRNQGFTDRGWMVIRFAEEQIVSYPNECAKFIGEVIKSVNPSFTSTCLDFPISLKNISMWTETEARKFAAEKKREKYLGINDFFALGGIRDYTIKDSTLGKEIEEKISKSKLNPTTDPPLTPSNPTTSASTLAKLIPPAIVVSSAKLEEPKLTTKTEKPSQPSPQPYAN